MFKETHKFKVSISTNYYLVEVKDNVVFEVDDLKKLVEFQKELLGKKLPVLILCSPDTIANNELLNSMACNNNSPYSIADAFVIFSLAQKILANTYIKLNKPERPVKFFNTKQDALKWLEQFFE